MKILAVDGNQETITALEKLSSSRPEHEITAAICGEEAEKIIKDKNGYYEDRKWY